MVKYSRLPAFWLVALPAAYAEIAMDIVLRRGVAGLAAIAQSGAQQRVRERLTTDLGEVGSLVAVVARHAVLLYELLMK